MTDELSTVERITQGMAQRREREREAMTKWAKEGRGNDLVIDQVMGISRTRLTDILDSIRQPLEELGWELREERRVNPVNVYPTFYLGLLRYLPPEPMELVGVLFCGDADDPDAQNAAVTYIEQLETVCRTTVGGRLAVGPRGFFLLEDDPNFIAYGLGCWDTGP